MRCQLPNSMRARIVLLCALPIFAAGCGSSPPVRYFSLEPVYETVGDGGEAKPILGLGQLRTPNFLFRSQMVTRDRGGELIVHDFRRWSEPLDHAIHRVVATNVDSLLEDVTVVAFPYESSLRPDASVNGSVERFDVDTVGQAVLIVQWSITSRDGDVIAPPRRSRYVTMAQPADDPAAAVEALNRVLGSFSEDIAREVGALP